YINMANIRLTLLSSLEKVMRNEPAENIDYNRFSMLSNEKKSFQLYIKADSEAVSLDIKSDLNCIKVFTVEYMPSGFAINEKTADDYVLRSKDGYYPDLLLPVEKNIKLENGCRTLWFEIDSENPLAAGEHKIELTVSDDDTAAGTAVTVEVIDCPLEKQSLIFTNWFHTDCLMQEYGVEAFSEKYWKIVENYLRTAVRHGMNCVLTPLFTPSLDIAVGGERPTVQLIDVTVTKGKYTFNFDKLLKWIEIAQKCGIEYFEMAHFFTQWGAKFAPKIMATVNGEYKKLFWWRTLVISRKYKKFLTQFSTELKALLESLNLKNKVLIHVSDEPNMSNIFTYRIAAKLIHKLFKGYKIVDALSDFKFYSTGLIDTPIPANNHIEPFIGKVPELWTYYCCAQDDKYVSNRFFSIPSQRNRVLGYQLYKYDVKGFLHWGYNFWNTQYSKEKINPYEVTDAGGFFQSGDSFVVYPKEDGTPLCSLRLKVFYDGFQDMMALQTLEKLTGRENTLKVLEQGLDNELTFFEYPHSVEWQLATRERINKAIKENL
ncbi:MAG: DUF4091 domain-containing protein, partial [Eubacterium sp.]|nr:DUF4091 domain-containing protein [Eubacterium sp.]